MPVIVFIPMELLSSINTIYTASISLVAGAISTAACRPDLLLRLISGSMLFGFFIFYFLFFFMMILSHPNFVELYWNVSAISGIRMVGVPVEELMFAFSLGAMWSGFYEHRYWLGDTQVSVDVIKRQLFR